MGHDAPEAPADRATVTQPQAVTCAAVPRGCAAAEWYRVNNYFERQELGLCGMHALNNALGNKRFTHADFEHAVDVLEVEASIPDAAYVDAAPFDRSEHIGPSGWYSDEAIGKVLQIAGEHELLLDPLTAINADLVLSAGDISGAIVNKDNSHWVALRMVAGRLWLLDSLGEPKPLTAGDVARFLARHPSAFPIRRLAV